MWSKLWAEPPTTPEVSISPDRRTGGERGRRPPRSRGDHRHHAANAENTRRASARPAHPLHLVTATQQIIWPMMSWPSWHSLWTVKTDAFERHRPRFTILRTTYWRNARLMIGPI